jgi:hypothetical protein
MNTTHTPLTPTYDTMTTSGADVRVAIIYPGAPYGRSAINEYTKSMIEFRFGWMCAQYFTSTILGRGYASLCVDGGQADATSISADTMESIRTWILENI